MFKILHTAGNPEELLDDVLPKDLANLVRRLSTKGKEGSNKSAVTVCGADIKSRDEFQPALQEVFATLGDGVAMIHIVPYMKAEDGYYISIIFLSSNSLYGKRMVSGANKSSQKIADNYKNDITSYNSTVDHENIFNYDEQGIFISVNGRIYDYLKTTMFSKDTMEYKWLKLVLGIDQMAAVKQWKTGGIKNERVSE